MHHSVLYRLLALVLVIVLVLSLASCKNKKRKDDPPLEPDKTNPSIGGGGIEGPIIDLEPLK